MLKQLLRRIFRRANSERLHLGGGWTMTVGVKPFQMKLAGLGWMDVLAPALVLVRRLPDRVQVHWHLLTRCGPQNEWLPSAN